MSSLDKVDAPNEKQSMKTRKRLKVGPSQIDSGKVTEISITPAVMQSLKYPACSVSNLGAHFIF